MVFFPFGHAKTTTTALSDISNYVSFSVFANDCIKQSSLGNDLTFEKNKLYFKKTFINFNLIQSNTKINKQVIFHSMLVFTKDTMYS